MPRREQKTRDEGKSAANGQDAGSVDDAPAQQSRMATRSRAAELQNVRYVRHEDEWLEAEDTRRASDDNTDTGNSQNSQETQQWSDTEGSSRPTSAESGEKQPEVPCRVTWCEHVGKRYGLCWAHGGVKRCCHRNCPKIALATGEFCSIHERDVTAGSY